MSKQAGEFGAAKLASSAEQVNEWAVRVNKQTDKWVAKFLYPNYWRAGKNTLVH